MNNSTSVTSIKPEIVKSFLDRFFHAYDRVSRLKKIFNYYGFYKKSNDKHPIEPNIDKPLNTGRITVKKVENKEYFLHKHSFPPALGLDEAENLAWMGEFYIFLRLKNRCTKIKKEQVLDVLKNFKNPDNYIILASGSEALDILSSDLIRIKNELNRIGYYGDLSVNNTEVPVFQLKAFRVQDFIIILNRNSMGQIIQYPPNDPEKGESNKLVRDELYAYVEAPSDNPKLMQKLLIECPEWLQKLGYVGEQKEYLSEQMYIEIRERFHYFDDTCLEGYIAEWM